MITRWTAVCFPVYFICMLLPGVLLGCGDSSSDAPTQTVAESVATPPSSSTPTPSPNQLSDQDTNAQQDPAARPTPRQKPKQAQPQNTMPSSAVILRKHQITDPGMNNTVANTILVPKDWTTEGGITRPVNQLYSMPVLVDFKVKAPDGRQIHFFPSLIFQFDFANGGGQNMQPTLEGNLYLPLPESPGQWLMDMARLNPDPTISNLQLVSEEVVPEMTQQLQKMRAATYQQIQQTNQTQAWLALQTAYDTQATKVIITYTQNGQPLEETVLIVWQYNITYKQGQLAWGMWSIDMMRSLRGKPGTDYLNDPVMAAVIKSIQTNPAWQQEMNKYFAELARIRHKGAVQRNKDWQAHNQKMQSINNDINNIIVGGHAKRTAIRDAGYEKSIDALRDETAYTNTAGQTIKLPSFYDHVYTDGNDNYLLHNDALYEPNTDPTFNSQNWQRIEANQ